MACTLAETSTPCYVVVNIQIIQSAFFTFPVIPINRTLCWLNERYRVVRYRTLREIFRYTSYREV